MDDVDSIEKCNSIYRLFSSILRHHNKNVLAEYIYQFITQNSLKILKYLLTPMAQ